MIMNDGNNGNRGGPPPGLHFLKALSHAALAFGHVAFGEENDEEQDVAPAPRRRIKFPAPAKSCCIARRKR